MPDGSEQESLHADFLKSVENGTIDRDIKKLVTRALVINNRNQSQGIPIINLNLQDQDGRTMLHYASNGGHSKLVDSMLGFGANPTIPDKSGYTAIDYALSSSKSNQETVDILHERITQINSVRESEIRRATEQAATEQAAAQAAARATEQKAARAAEQAAAQAAAETRRKRAEAAQKTRERQKAAREAAKAAAQKAAQAKAEADREAAKAAAQRAAETIASEGARIFSGMVERSEQRIKEEYNRAEQATPLSFYRKLVSKVKDFFGRSSSKESMASKASFSPLNSISTKEAKRGAHKSAQAKLEAKAIRTGLEAPEMRSNPMHGKGRYSFQAQRRGASSSAQTRR